MVRLTIRPRGVAALLALLSALAACGGGGGAAPAPTPLSVTLLEPADHATGAAQAPVLRVTFDRPLDCGSVTASTFALADTSTNPATPVPGTAGCAGAQASFTPGAALSAGRTYAATVGAVTDLDGVASAGRAWSFTTNGAAKMPVVFLGAITNRWVTALGSASDGRAVLAYLRRQDATHHVAAAQRFTPGLGWSGHVDLGTDVSPSAPMRLAVNANGWAILLWKSATEGSLYYAYLDPNAGTWSGRYVISAAPSLGPIMGFDAAIDASGHAMVTWSVWADGGGAQRLFARALRRVAGVPTWSAAQELSAAGWPANVDPRFAFDAAGNGMLVWGKWRAVTFTGDVTYDLKITALTYDGAADGWSDPVDVADGTNPEIAFDAAGRAVAVWIKKFRWDDPLDPPAHDYYGLGSATRAPGGAWSEVFVGAGWDPKGDAMWPTLRVGPTGDALVAWTFWRGTGHFRDLNAAAMPGGASDWTPAGVDPSGTAADHYAAWRVVPGDAPGADVLGPSLVVAPSGVATLVYGQSDGARSNVSSMTYTPGAAVAWSAPRVLDTAYTDAGGPVVAVDGAGHVLTVWNQPDPTIGGINNFWFLRE